MKNFREFINQRIIISESTEDGRFTDEEFARASKRLASLKDVPQDQIFFKNPDKKEVFAKDVGFRDHGRVYHINETEKSKTRRLEINIENIGKSQPTMQREGIQRAISIAKEQDTSKAEKLPFVVIEDGVAYVQDGHHRVSAYLLAGRKSMVVDAIEKRGDHFYVPKKPKDLWSE